MLCFCPACRAKVPNGVKSIACDYCDKWFHFECTELTESQFDVYTKDKSFTWFCQKCSINCCNKCNILTRHGSKIQCERCEKHYHLKCAGLSKTAFIPTTSWYCYQCNEDIFPFNAISVKKINDQSFNSINLDRHPNKLRNLYSAADKNTEARRMTTALKF